LDLRLRQPSIYYSYYILGKSEVQHRRQASDTITCTSNAQNQINRLVHFWDLRMVTGNRSSN
jgi:hypothetical protein